MTAKISIIIPVYNGEKFIARCLDSVLSQTFKEFVVLAIDDGSTDNSLKILKQYEKKHPEHIKVYSQENVGVAKTRNRGIDLTNTKYLMFIDQDDYIDSDFCKVHYREAENGDFDIVLSGFKRPGAGSRIVSKYVKLKNTRFSKYVCVALYAKMHRTDFVKENGIEVVQTPYGEDIPFILHEYHETDNIKILEDYVGYNWYYNVESVSNTSHKKMLNSLPYCIGLLEKIKRYDDGSPEHEYFVLQTAVFYILFTGRQTKLGDFLYAYNKVFHWLNKNYPDLKSNRYLWIGRGIPALNRLATNSFMLMHILRLVPLFARIYSRK